LSSKVAADIDAELMGPLGFSTDQLMELAGLSVACAVAKEYPKETHSNVLVVCGPGSIQNKNSKTNKIGERKRGREK
jgi:NAD(P)H-hydrate epimerase